MGSSEPLIVEAIYMYERENAELHHTDRFELVHEENPTPVLRRGQEFSLAVRFNREYVEETDIVRLLFSFGPNASVFKGTRGINEVKPRESALLDLEAWGVRMVGNTDTDLMVEARSPVDSPVGVWQLNVETTTLGSRQPPNTFHYEKDIYLLFNPWIKEDMVYMEPETRLDEYILNDIGKIWIGPHGSARGREWIFGQFDKAILPACMLMFEKSNIKTEQRGDPIKVSRTISKMANAFNVVDGKYVYDGILEGNWSPPYDDGISPSAWTGSIPILEQYLETGGERVKYGQCWVFAGVVTTICRALGLPSRVVTNVVSAHDANGSLSLDVYFDTDMNRLDMDPETGGPADSIWNYHVWNDVWMSRPDLPRGYGGWQAIDGTPQEQSEGLYRCGPASVEAIRQGVTGCNYDIPFLIASVNADQIRWLQDPNSIIGWRKIDTNTQHIGRMILTKKPWIFDPNGDRDREDITHEYKAPEGTRAERLTLYRAVRSIPSAKRAYAGGEQVVEDVEFKLVDLDRVNIGDPFTIRIDIENKSEERRTVKVVLSAGSVYYNGVKAHQIKRAEGEFELEAAERRSLQLRCTVEEYLDKLVEYANMKLYAIAVVQETNQTWADEDDFQVIKPTIKVEIEGDPVVGQPSTITLSFTNPLNLYLTECVFNYAGPGLSKNKTIKFRDVGPLEDVRVEHQLVPQKAGQQKIIATFTSRQLVDVTGAVAVDVDEA
ncbi:hemocyte protein-glutamine gamma-glutamyltransferase [Diachasma alloeum]|uniref:hemocyte protein-glutamine gamma-glutamyltransferase n=1 Tax=Diachasma alloeum TaxID=454923 RepID=UPI00073830B1|nr:hemocyte protein-glutamine gamma-glutamyltransferase [Diachasma alloeum]